MVVNAISSLIPSGPGYLPIDSIPPRLPKAVVDELRRVEGGLLGFFEARPRQFDLARPQNAVVVRHSKHSTFDLRGAVFGEPVVRVERRYVPRFLLPESGVTLLYAAASAKLTPTNLFRIVCLEPSGTYTLFCDEVLDAGGRRLFDSSHTPGHISDEQAAAMWLLPSSSTVVLSNEALQRNPILLRASAPAPSHDVCRLARFLDGNSFVPYASLRPLQGHELHSRLMPTLFTSPSRFVVAGAPLSIEGIEFLTEVISAAGAAARSAAPARGAVAAKPQGLSQSRIETALATMASTVKGLGGVRYVVQSHEAASERARRYTSEPVDVIERRIQEVRRGVENHTVHFMKGKEIRDNLVASKWWACYPRGSPLLDTDVLELLVYDMLGDFPGGSASATNIRDVFYASRFAHMVPTLKDSYFERMRTLVGVAETGYSNLQVTRRQDAITSVADEGGVKLSRPELVLEIMSHLPRPFQSGSPYNAALLLTKLRRAERGQIDRLFGGLAGVFRAHPATFDVEDLQSHFMIRTTEEKLSALEKEMVRLCGPSSARHAVETGQLVRPKSAAVGGTGTCTQTPRRS